MPELPEVETTRRGIEKHLLKREVSDVIVRQPRLRWPVTADLKKGLKGRTIDAVERRGKYLLLRTGNGTVIMHLGMSGSLRVVPISTPPLKHDHVDLILDNGQCLRLRDPRRFGAVLWCQDDPLQHTLLASLGPEPWDTAFTADYLYQRSRKKTVAIKNFIMDSHLVVGVGNIYASEALFLAGIRPTTGAGKVSRPRLERLLGAILQVLERAIAQGGTTLRDFSNTDGLPGYFKQELNVYGRADAPCHDCGTPIRQKTIGQRSSFYCPACQKP